MNIPKKIWFLWFQGLSQAPLVVRKCYESWKKHNPDWEVIFLDNNNLKDYITPSLPEDKLSQLSKNHQSDLIRLELLAKHGGVWTDATTFCQRPLDDWLWDYTQAGFFTFAEKTRGYGWIVSWFLVAEKSHPLIVTTKEKLVAFFRDHEFYHNGEIFKKRVKFLSSFLNRKYKTTRFWSSWLVRKFFKVYPYFIFHYTFASLIGSNGKLLKIYKKMKFYENPGDKLGQYGLLRLLTPEIKHEIDNKVVPVYKLSWKYKEEKYSDSCILSYLFSKVD